MGRAGGSPASGPGRRHVACAGLLGACLAVHAWAGPLPAPCRPLPRAHTGLGWRNGSSRSAGAVQRHHPAPVPTPTTGIVFIDEIDKIVTSTEHRYGGDASAEGVQRDLLPIIEGAPRARRGPPAGCELQCRAHAQQRALRQMGGCRLEQSQEVFCIAATEESAPPGGGHGSLPRSPHAGPSGRCPAGSTVSTKHGNVNTDYILFICRWAAPAPQLAPPLHALASLRCAHSLLCEPDASAPPPPGWRPCCPALSHTPAPAGPPHPAIVSGPVHAWPAISTPPGHPSPRSGAFHSCKPSDMLAELQGRLPIRVELKGLT